MEIWSGWNLGGSGDTSGSGILDFYENIMNQGAWSDRDLGDIASRRMRGVASGLAADRSQTADRGVALGGTNPWLFGSSRGYTPSLAAYGAGAGAMQEARLQNREASLGAADRAAQLLRYLSELELIPTQAAEDPQLIQMLMSAFQSMAGQWMT